MLTVALAGAACAALPPGPLPPKLELEGVTATRVLRADTRVTLRFKAQNPNAYALTVNALDASFSLGGESIGTAVLGAPVTLAAAADARFDVEVRTDLGALSAAAERISAERRLNYEIAGMIVVQDGFRLPFAKRGDLAIGDLIGVRR
jgi:LEA14-like dessication related protein